MIPRTPDSINRKLKGSLRAVGEPKFKPFRATDVRQGWSGEAAEPLLG